MMLYVSLSSHIEVMPATSIEPPVLGKRSSRVLYKKCLQDKSDRIHLKTLARVGIATLDPPPGKNPETFARTVPTQRWAAFTTLENSSTAL
jgi:hypothetical protein